MDAILTELEKREIKKPEGVFDLWVWFLWSKKLDAAIYLNHGIKLIGKIVSFDEHSILIVRNGKGQVIQKGSISTVLKAEKEDVSKKT